MQTALQNFFGLTVTSVVFLSAYKFYWPVVSKDMGQTFNITMYAE